MDPETNSKPTLDDGTSPKGTGKGDKAAVDRATIIFLEEKKKVMKKSQYRQKFDMLLKEIEDNIVNTSVSYGQKLYESSGWGSMVFYNKMSNGAYDYNVYPQKITDRDQNKSGVPVSQEPLAFAKILIATGVLAGKLPDAEMMSDDKVFSRASYELWKRTWIQKGGNGENTLWLAYQGVLAQGCQAWRTYPKRVVVKRKGVDKVLFDDIYREPMDMKRTWLGLGFTQGDYWSQFEVYYEKDILKEEFFAMYPQAEKNKRKLEYCTTSEESKDENQEKSKHSVTIGYYENVLLNRFIVACGKMVIYDGELPNDDNYGSVLVSRCFARNLNDPYGVGLYELMRGNTALFTYINSLNAQQVEAEIYPLLFGTQIQNGTASYKRGPNIVNPKNNGTTIDVVNTKGNVQGGMMLADKQKEDIEDNTGINNIVSGQNSESTLGSTVILKEAAYNRLTAPKNSMMNALQTDACMALSWIRQTYAVDKVFMIDSDSKLAEFAKQNPDYFVESQEIRDDNNVFKGYAVAASKNLRLNFDFDEQGNIMENVPTRKISAKKLFDEMNRYGHQSDYLEVVIDPDSMLLPSLEIQKQTFMALFPIITNQITIIYSLRLSDPEAAASQLRSLEQLLDIQKQDIYNYIPKDQYDAIIALKPPENMPPAPVDETVEYKYAPADVQRQMEEKDGYVPSAGDNIPPATPGTTPPIKKTAPGTPGVSDNANPAQPKGNNQVRRPQSPVGAAFDGSVGRAAKSTGFFPG